MKKISNNKSLIVIFILLVFSVLSLTACSTAANSQETPVYMVYFGLNDKDTGTQLVSTKEASEYIRSVITDNGFGYTEYTANGGYVEEGAVKTNETLVYMLTFLEKSDVKKIADTVSEHLNLSVVLSTRSNMEYEFLTQS